MRTTSARLQTAALLVVLAAPAAAQVDAPRIQYTRHVLPNGLVAILHEDRSAPLVNVTMYYRVGSKDEPPGRTGFAHLFEHMMFEGSANVAPGEHRRIVQSSGGALNAAVSEDWTRYFQTLPANQLETALWLESDRMATLAARLDHARLAAQREIVRNERRQRVENVPFGVANELTVEHLFPETAYSWSPFGSMRDLDAASLDDVRDFFRTYYAPDNAVLVIAGDFRPADARRLVERYFGPIPRGAPIARRATPSSPLAEEKRLVLEDARARLPQIRFVWRGAATTNPDHPALRALASVLTQERHSRLRRVLVHERQLATSVSAGHFDLEHAGIFQITVLPTANASLSEIERVVDSVIAGLRDAPASAREVERARRAAVVETNVALQSLQERANNLAEGQLFQGNPTAFVDRIRSLGSLTPAALQDAARRYLGDGRLVMSMVPAGRQDLASKPDLPYTNVTPRAAAGGGEGR